MRGRAALKAGLGTCALAALGLVAATCSEAPDPGPAWSPGTVYPSPGAHPRGLLDVRGLIHAHSVYSKDACDNKPRDENDQIDPVCFEDFRRDLCTAQHDFVMLTDHTATFDRTEFPEALLYRPERGDSLVERGGNPVASWAACADGSRALILAGLEAGTMPVGLETHVAPPNARRSVYDASTPEVIVAYKEAGAVALVAHTEGWSVDRLVNLPLDGFEMYNVHANLIRNAPKAFELLDALFSGREGLPHPDLVILPIFFEDPLYLTTWGSVLARGVRRVGTLGTDCHRNTFANKLSDGERVDSYRRMMIWFSNHLLVRPEEDGSWDDRHLKAALRGGRLYGSFDYLGYPVGFDFHALSGGATREMGEEVSLAAGVELVVKVPAVQRLSPAVERPQVTARILRAREGGWDEVAAAGGDLRWTADQPGAYRAEVRMVPRHLRGDLGTEADELLTSDRVWIYANPIYVEP